MSWIRDNRIGAIKISTDNIESEVVHNDFIFPEASNETITFQAGALPNTFGEWALVEDNNSVTLGSKGALQEMHIGNLIVEDCSEADKNYVIQLKYDDSNGIIARHRFSAAENKKFPGVQRLHIRSLHIPIGSFIAYRMMCETGGATCQVMIAYHLH